MQTNGGKWIFHLRIRSLANEWWQANEFDSPFSFVCQPQPLKHFLLLILSVVGVRLKTTKREDAYAN